MTPTHPGPTTATAKSLIDHPPAWPLADQDLDQDIWWDPRNGGVGAGYNVNAILPIQSAPLVGMQGWFDTVCSIRAV